MTKTEEIIRAFIRKQTEKYRNEKSLETHTFNMFFVTKTNHGDYHKSTIAYEVGEDQLCNVFEKVSTYITDLLVLNAKQFSTWHLIRNEVADGVDIELVFFDADSLNSFKIVIHDNGVRKHFDEGRIDCMMKDILHLSKLKHPNEVSNLNKDKKGDQCCNARVESCNACFCKDEI